MVYHKNLLILGLGLPIVYFRDLINYHFQGICKGCSFPFYTMKKNLFFILCFLILPKTLFSQKVEIGDIKEVTSTILDEKREVWISVPKHYHHIDFKDQKYPVVYLIDGEMYFHVVSGIVNNLANDYYPSIPEAIVVGIVNSDRGRDLTPTHDEKQPYSSGGDKNFRAFLTQELIPIINKEYRTNDFSLLIGHSFGGLFALNTLYTQPQTFNAYIAVDPSTWWHNKRLLKQTESIFKNTKFNSTHLFIGDAEPAPSPIDLGEQSNVHEESLHEYATLVNQNTNDNLNITLKTYDGEDHGSVVMPAIIDGLKSIFKEYKINAKLVAKNPDVLFEQYNKLSKKFNTEIIPQSFYISNLIQYALRTGEKENAQKLYSIITTHYPENTSVQTFFK